MKFFFITLLLFYSKFCIGQVNIDALAFDTVTSKISVNNDSNIVIIGEAHEAANTLLTEYFIIKNLSEKGYKNIFIESGKSEAEILNMYLKTGDTSVLDNTRARSQNGKFKEFVELIYKLNKDKKIGFVFHGFDFERAPCLNFLFHKWFDGVSSDNVILNKNIQKLLSISDQGTNKLDKRFENSKYIKNVFDSIKLTFSSFEKDYQRILVEKFPVFKSIIFNPSYFGYEMDERRTQFMVQAMLAYEAKNELQKGILIVGSNHIVSKNNFIPTLMNELKSGYLATIFVPVYKNCEMLKDIESPSYKYSSDKLLLKYIQNKQPKEPIIAFSTNNNEIIPTTRKNLYTILIEFYDQ